MFCPLSTPGTAVRRSALSGKRFSGGSLPVQKYPAAKKHLRRGIFVSGSGIPGMDFNLF